MELVNSRTETTLYRIALISGLYKITSECIKLVLNTEQFGRVAILASLPGDIEKVFYTSLLTHSMHSTEILLSIFQPTIHFKSKISINNSMLLVLHVA